PERTRQALDRPAGVVEVVGQPFVVNRDDLARPPAGGERQRVALVVAPADRDGAGVAGPGPEGGVGVGERVPLRAADRLPVDHDLPLRAVEAATARRRVAPAAALVEDPTIQRRL